MSSTGPMTWTILPTLRVCVAVAMNRILVATVVVSGLALQGGRAAHDLGDLLRDRRLALAVVRPLQHLEDLAGVVGRVLHRRAARAVLRRHGLDEPAIQGVSHIEREQPGE